MMGILLGRMCPFPTSRSSGLHPAPDHFYLLYFFLQEFPVQVPFLPLPTTPLHKMSSQDLSSTRQGSSGKPSLSHVEHKEEISYDDHITNHPNAWSKYREMLREPVAEFMGTCILIIFGTGVACQVVLSSNPAVSASPKGDYLSINIVWGVGVAMGVWASGGISGGHINPAVTLAFATYRGFPWKKVPIYIFAQVMGGLVGAALVYANYFHAIDLYEGGRGVRTLATAGLFSTYALPYMTSVSCFFSEFLGTAVLVSLVFAMTDKRNMAPPEGLAPLYLFLLVLGIGAALGMETAYALNPARDLGPRMLTSMVGYGKAVYTYRSQYWLWCAIIAPILGGQAGACFYDAFLYTGSESIFNKPNAAARRQLLHAEAGQVPHAPSGAHGSV